MSPAEPPDADPIDIEPLDSVEPLSRLDEHELIDGLEATGPLDLHGMRDIIDMALTVGEELLASGASTQYVMEAVDEVGRSFGCTDLQVVVLPNAITVTTELGREFRTKVRRVARHGVNFTTVSGIIRLAHRLARGEVRRRDFESELTRISAIPHHYNRWLIACMVGVSCGCFSRLFRGDWPVFGVTIVAAFAGVVLRQELHKRHINQLLVIPACAFLSGCIASTATLMGWSEHGEIALAACVLYLVPGIPLINAVEDLIHGHVVTGIARGAVAALLSLALALGLGLAVFATGVGGV